MSDVISRIGQIPRYRLTDARRVRDSLLQVLPPQTKVTLTIVKDGFGVQVYHKSPEHGSLTTNVDGVLVKICPQPVRRPRK